MNSADHLRLAIGHGTAALEKAEPEAEWVDGAKSGLARLQEAHAKAKTAGDSTGNVALAEAFDALYERHAAATGVPRRSQQ
jgi:hypothetical protein